MDDDFNRELDEYASIAGEPVLKSRNSQHISVKDQLFDANFVPISVFHAFIEGWEDAAVGDKDCLSMFRLLRKYGNMRYIYPEDNSPKYYTVCGHKMKWVERISGKKKRKNKLDVEMENYTGWACLLIPKGDVFNEEELNNYEVQCITRQYDVHTCIAICDQENVNVVDKHGKGIDPVMEFEHLFGGQGWIYPGKWKDVPDTLHRLCTNLV